MTQTDELAPSGRQPLAEVTAAMDKEETALSPRARRAWPTPPMPVWILVPVVLATVAIAVLVLALVAPEPSKPTFAVSDLAGGRLHVTVAPSFDDVTGLQRALEKRGMEVEVVRVVAHPRLAGTVELLPLRADGQGLSGKKDGMEMGHGEFWVDLSRFKGRTEVVVYAEARRSGEEWQQAPSVFHPEEPLGGLPCALNGPLDSATLEQEARHAGIHQFKWLVQTDVSEEAFDAIEQETRPDGEIVDATLYGPGMLRGIVRPAALVKRLGHLPPPSMSLNATDHEEPSCTPQLAERWGLQGDGLTP